MTNYIDIILTDTVTQINYGRDIMLYAGIILVLFFVFGIHKPIISGYEVKLQKIKGNKLYCLLSLSGVVCSLLCILLSKLVLDGFFAPTDSLTTMKAFNNLITTAKIVEVAVATVVAMSWLFSVAAFKAWNRESK